MNIFSICSFAILQGWEADGELFFYQLVIQDWNFSGTFPQIFKTIGLSFEKISNEGPN